MIDVNWDLAPEGAEMIIQYNDTLAWAKEGYYWRIDSDEWEIDDCEDENIVLSTRPKPKTVADAVEKCNKLWPNDDYDYLNFHYKEGWYCSDKGIFASLVCSRAEFEAYVKEQEGEKWTHGLWGDKAYIKIAEPDCDGYLVVTTEGGGYNLAKMEDLKPLKQTLTKAEAWDMLRDLPAHEWSIHSHVMAIEDKYDII